MTAEPVAAEPLLSVRGLSVGLRNRGAVTPLVRDVDLDIYPGERVGIVGESGSGKSLTLLAIMGLLASPPLELLGGSVRFGGTELAGLIAGHAEGPTEVAVSEGDVAGFVRYGGDPAERSRGHVFGLYVHPDQAGRGIGTTLLRHAEGRLAARGCAEVSLYVFEANQRARRLYSAAGYRPDGERRVEAEYGAQEIRMVKVLGG